MPLAGQVADPPTCAASTTPFARVAPFLAVGNRLRRPSLDSVGYDRRFRVWHKSRSDICIDQLRRAARSDQRDWILAAPTYIGSIQGERGLEKPLSGPGI